MVLFLTDANAQFYVGVQSGIDNIKSDVQGVSASTMFGGALKVGYIYSLTNHVGIGSGIGFSQYKQRLFLHQKNSIFQTKKKNHLQKKFFFLNIIYNNTLTKIFFFFPIQNFSFLHFF